MSAARTSCEPMILPTSPHQPIRDHGSLVISHGLFPFFYVDWTKLCHSIEGEWERLRAWSTRRPVQRALPWCQES